MRERQSWPVTIMWALTVLLVVLYPQDAYSETPGLAPTFSQDASRAELPTAPPPRAKAKQKAVPGFVGSMSAGGEVSNRDKETALTPVVRVDVRARVRVVDNEDWQPRLRVRAQFGGVPTGAVSISDPTTFREFAFDGGVYERLAPGFEVGIMGGVSGLLQTNGETPALEGPARWGVGARFESDDAANWLTVYLGQDQRLPHSPGWNGSACIGVDAGYRLHEEGRIGLSLIGDLQRSLYSDGALTVRVGVVARVGTK